MKFSLKFQRKREGYLVFALPQTNHYQTISKLIMSPVGWNVINDEEWGNKILIKTLNDVKKEIRLDFQTNPKPIKMIIDKNYKLNDYSQKLLRQYRILLKPNRFINGDDASIYRLIKASVAQEKNLLNEIKKLYQLTLSYLTYGNPTEGLYSYKQAIEERITDCGGFSTLLASLLQAINIPSRLVVGYLIKENLPNKLSNIFKFQISNFKFLSIHAWLEVLLPDSTWFPLDPSIDWRRSRGLTKRGGGFGDIPADRLATSFGCDFKIKITSKNYQIDLLQNPIYL